MSDNPRAVIGANHPPPTPFDLAEKAVNDICDEARLWLDGKAIDCQETADGFANLLSLIRKAEAQAEEAQADERRPHNRALKEISDRYNPLIGDTKAGKGKTVLATLAVKAALKPWLDAERARLDAEAAAKRAEADRQREEAVAALRASQGLAEREEAERLLTEAQRTERAADAAARATATAGGAMGRAAGLRPTWRATITDETEAARSCWRDEQGRQEMVVFLTEWAQRRVRQGVRSIPGFSILEERSVV